LPNLKQTGIRIYGKNALDLPFGEFVDYDLADRIYI